MSLFVRNGGHGVATSKFRTPAIVPAPMSALGMAGGATGSCCWGQGEINLTTDIPGAYREAAKVG